MVCGRQIHIFIAKWQKCVIDAQIHPSPQENTITAPALKYMYKNHLHEGKVGVGCALGAVFIHRDTL